MENTCTYWKTRVYKSICIHISHIYIYNFFNVLTTKQKTLKHYVSIHLFHYVLYSWYSMKDSLPPSISHSKSAWKLFKTPKRQNCTSCSRHSSPSSPPPGHGTPHVYMSWPWCCPEIQPLSDLSFSTFELLLKFYQYNYCLDYSISQSPIIKHISSKVPLVRGRLVRKLPSCGRLSWLAVSLSCQPHHHVNHITD